MLQKTQNRTRFPFFQSNPYSTSQAQDPSRTLACLPHDICLPAPHCLLFGSGASHRPLERTCMFMAILTRIRDVWTVDTYDHLPPSSLRPRLDKRRNGHPPLKHLESE